MTTKHSSQQKVHPGGWFLHGERIPGMVFAALQNGQLSPNSHLITQARLYQSKRLASTLFNYAFLHPAYYS